MALLPTSQLTFWTNEQLLERARKNRKILLQREKRLIENIEKNPGEYSVHGLRALQSETNGIPEVNDKLGRVALKAAVSRSQELLEMKTTTSRGARKHQVETIRNVLNLPLQGRLNAKQKRIFDEGQAYFRENQSRLSDFWKGFEAFENSSQARNLDSKRLLEEYQEFYEDQKGVYASLDSLIDSAVEYEKELYLKAQQGRGILSRRERQGGFLK